MRNILMAHHGQIQQENMEAGQPRPGGYLVVGAWGIGRGMGRLHFSPL
jgi:hypothetical protein